MKRRELLAILLGSALGAGSIKGIDFGNSAIQEDVPDFSLTGSYILNLPEQDARLVYYGVHHTYDYRDEQISDIESRWNALKPDLALTEWNMWPLVKSPEEAVSKFGEQGFIRYLAYRDGVAVERIDPTRAEQIRYLLRHFPAVKIKVYYVLLYATLRRTRKTGLISDEDVNQLLKGLAAAHPLCRCYPRNVRDAEESIRGHFPDIEDWRRFPAAQFNQAAYDHFVARIHRTLNDYRDRIMLRKLIASLKKGKKVFAAVGRTHVVIQEPMLRAEIQKLR